jgi:hypothetical protein
MAKDAYILTQSSILREKDYRQVGKPILPGAIGRDAACRVSSCSGCAGGEGKGGLPRLYPGPLLRLWNQR